MQRVCVVTGGTVGIGKACVEKFEEEGYQVFNLDIQADDNERSLLCDVTKADQVNAAIQHISIRHYVWLDRKPAFADLSRFGLVMQSGQFRSHDVTHSSMA